MTDGFFRGLDGRKGMFYEAFWHKSTKFIQQLVILGPLLADIKYIS
jgi:hypothetical protein